MDRDIKQPVEQQRSSNGFAINSTQFLGMKDRKREQAIIQEIRAQQEHQKSPKSDNEVESPKNNPIKVSQLLGPQRQSPRSKISKGSPRDELDQSNQFQRKQLVPFQQISYSPVERVTTEEREEGMPLDYFASTDKDVKMIRNFDKAARRENGQMQDYLIKEEGKDFDTKRLVSQRKGQGNFQNRKKSNTINSLHFEATAENDYSNRHRNTDIQDELGENKDVIFQINQTDVNTTVRLIDNSVNSGDITRAGMEMGTANISKNSPKLAQSSIGISVEKGQSILNEGDNSGKAGPEAFNNAYDVLNSKNFVKTFHEDQKGYKFFMANKNRYDNSKQDFKERFSMFNNTQSQFPHQSRANKMGNQQELIDSRRLSNIDRNNNLSQNDSENLMIKSRGLNPYLKKPQIVTNSNQLSPKDASRGSDQHATSTQLIQEDDIAIGRKKQSVASHLTGSFGGSQGYEQSKSQLGDPLNVTKKAITKMPKILYSNEVNHGKHLQQDGNILQGAKTSQGFNQDGTHQDFRRSQNNYSTGSATNSQKQKQNLIQSFQPEFQRYQENIQSMNETTQLMEVRNVLMTQQYSSPNKVSPSSKYNKGLSLQNRDSFAGGSQMSFRSQAEMQRLMAQTQMISQSGFTPQTKRVVGPGGFGARIKKRTQSLMNYKMYLQNRYNYNDYYLHQEKKPRSPRLCAQHASPPKQQDGWKRDASFGKIKGNEKVTKLDTEEAMSTYKPDNQTFSVHNTSEKELPISPMAQQYFGESGFQSNTFASGPSNNKKRQKIPRDHHFNKSQILKASGLIPESESKGYILDQKAQNKTQMNVNTLINQLQGNFHQQPPNEFQLQELGEIRLNEASRESKISKSYDRSGNTTAQPLMSPQSNGSNIFVNQIDLTQAQQNYMNQIVLAGNAAVIVDINRSKNMQDDSNYNSRPNSKMSKPSTGASGVRNIHSQKRRQVLLSNSRGVKRDLQEKDGIKTSGWNKHKISTGGHISHFSSPPESNDYKLNDSSKANKTPSELFSNVAQHNTMLPLLQQNTNQVHFEDLGLNQSQMSKKDYVVFSGGQRIDSNSSHNFDMNDSNMAGQIGTLKQIQKQKQVPHIYDGISAIQAIDMQQISELQKLHELQIQNKNLQHQLQASVMDQQKSAVDSATRRKSMASSTIRLSTRNGGKQSNFRVNECDDSKLSTSLNLNSNRGVTQKEIESVLDMKKSSLSSKKVEFRGADLETRTFWASNNEHSPTFSADRAVNEFVKSINAHRNFANTSHNSGKVFSRFRDDELEDWRRNTMNDKFYFLSAASKKSRRQMLQSMPDFKMTARAKIDVGRGDNGFPGSFDPTTPSTRRQKIEAIREQLIGEYSKRAGEKGELDKQLLQEFDKEFLHQVKTQFMIEPKEEPQSPRKQKKQKPKATSPSAESPTALKKILDNTVKQRQFTRSPNRIKKIDRPWQNTDLKNIKDKKYNKQFISPRKVNPPSRLAKQHPSSISQAQSMGQPLQKVTSSDRISQKSNQEAGSKSIFNEILKKEQPETNSNDHDNNTKKIEVPIEQNISKFTEKLNSIMNVDISKIKVSLKDNQRKSSQYGGIIGGLPENLEDESEEDNENSKKRPMSPFTAMFNEGAGGDAVLANTIKDVKAIYRDALRSSGMCLQTYKNAQQLESQIVTITTKAKPMPFQIHQCQFTNIIIDGLRGRPQPIIINFSGVKGELLTLVSTSHKFPTPQLNQASFFNTNHIRFSSAPGTNNQGSNGSVQRFTTSQLFLSVETTHFCPQVQVHISFGNSQANMKEQVEKMKSTQNTEPKTDSFEIKQTDKQLQIAPNKANADKKGEPDPNEALFKEIMRIIESKSKRPLDTYQDLQKQIKKMIEDEDTSFKFIRHVYELRQQRLRNLEKERAGEAFSDELKDMIALNIHNQENFEEFEMNRTLVCLLRSQHRREQSLSNRKQYLIDFRDSAIRFLNRNQTMKQEKAMMQHLEDEQKKRTKKFKFFCTMVVVQQYVQNILWKEFASEREIVHRNMLEEKSAFLIQREVLIYQSRLNSASKEIPTALERKFDIEYEIEMSDWAIFNVRNCIRQRFSLMVQSVQELTEKKSRPLVYKCLIEALGVFAMREKFYGTDTRIQRIQKNIKKYRATRQGQMTALIEHFGREQARISLQFTLFGQPGKDSPFRDLATTILQIPDKFRDQILREFAIMSGLQYHNEFEAWRQQMKEIQEKELKDDRFGWRMPLVCPQGSSRIVYDFSEVGYNPDASWMVKKCSVLSYRLTSTALKTQNQAEFMAIYREHNKDKLQEGDVRGYDYKREKYNDLFKVEYYMAPVRGAKKQWEYFKWKKGWTKPKPPRSYDTEEKAFELTEVEGQDCCVDIPETPYQILQKAKKLEDQLYKEQWVQHNKELEDNPDDYTTYPDQPMKRYYPVPYLMHQLIFKALENWKGMTFFSETLGLGLVEEQFSWSSVSGVPPGMAKIEKQIVSSGLTGLSRMTLDGGQGNSERLGSQVSITVSQEE